MPIAKKPIPPTKPVNPVVEPPAPKVRGAVRLKAAESARISKKVYEARIAELREKLVALQVELKEQPFKILLIVAGVAGAGRGEVLNTLGGWLDPRGVETFSFQEPTEEERRRPFLWRFWRSLPPQGKIGIYAGSWYTETLAEEARSKKDLEALDRDLERIRHFEKALADNDTLVLKVWLNLDKDGQRDRFKRLEADENTAWRVTEDDWRHHRIYDRLERTALHILKSTHRPGAAWTVIDAEDERARNLAVGDLLLGQFTEHRRRLDALARSRPVAKAEMRPTPLRAYGTRRLLGLPLDQQLSPEEYEEKRDKWLGRLNAAVRAAKKAGRAITFVFEGWDAAGKGGAIRRLTSAIDVRDYRVYSIAKPTEEEKAHHYLWRFWRHVPRDGQIAIFDRSWYGRVLVERLEGFCRPDEWRRAFAELNDFERELTDHGQIVIKFWLHISREEQLARFRSREETVFKTHKINAEDWRNRRKWPAYEIAVGDMLALTDTANAPWNLIPANDKRYARLQVLRTACRAIQTALEEK
jgi:polyphosphate:AMP phosphotransferase